MNSERHAAAGQRFVAGSGERCAHFPMLGGIKVQVLGDVKQSGATIKKDKGDVRL